MRLNSENLNALRTGFSTAYSTGLGQAQTQHERISTVVPSTQLEQTYGWLGKLPNVREWVGPRVIQNISETEYTIKEKAFELTIGVDRDHIDIVEHASAGKVLHERRIDG